MYVITGKALASHAGDFSGEIRAPLKTPAWEARKASDSENFRTLPFLPRTIEKAVHSGGGGGEGAG